MLSHAQGLFFSTLPKNLNDFKLQVLELKLFHTEPADNTYTDELRRFKNEFAKAAGLVRSIDDYQRQYFKDYQLPDIRRSLTDYENAANELFSRKKISRNLDQVQHRLVGDLLESILVKGVRLPLETAKMLHELEDFPDLTTTSDFPGIIAKKLQLSKTLSRENILPGYKAVQKELIGLLEQDYLNSLAIRDRYQFLNTTTMRFFSIADQAVEELTDLTQKKQNLMKQIIITLSIFSIVLTAVFWIISTRRLKLFLENQHKAIEAIRGGDYNYSLPETIPDDEFGTLTRFMKKFAGELQYNQEQRKIAEEEKEGVYKQLLQAQKLESIGILAGGVAHDFNNILSAVMGYCELSKLHLDKDHPVLKYIETIHSAGEKAVDLVNQLLAYSRKQILETRIFNLNDIVNGMTKMLKRLLSEEIELKIRLSPEGGNVRADRSKLEQVIMNLAVNARDAMDDQGTLVIETQTVLLDRTFCSQYPELTPGRYVRLAVIDTGSGMSQEVQAKIFDPFFTTKQPGKGTGLGLATVYGIVMQHHGLIEITSQPAKGTTILVYLPEVTDDISAAREQPIIDHNHQKGSETILVVDDDQTVLMVVAEILKAHGYQVRTALSPDEALAILLREHDHIDLLLTDVVMPGMNGFELMEEFHQNSPQTKVIYMSGYAERIDNSIESIRKKGSEYLAKPVLQNDLLSAVRKILDSETPPK